MSSAAAKEWVKIPSSWLTTLCVIAALISLVLACDANSKVTSGCTNKAMLNSLVGIIAVSSMIAAAGLMALYLGGVKMLESYEANSKFDVNAYFTTLVAVFAIIMMVMSSIVVHVTNNPDDNPGCVPRDTDDDGNEVYKKTVQNEARAICGMSAGILGIVILLYAFNYAPGLYEKYKR